MSCSNWLRRGGAGIAIAVSAVAFTGLPVVASTSSSSSPVTTCAKISQGSTGAAVKTIQKALGITADGDFGPQTAATVKTWRHAHGLKRGVGAVTAVMWAALPASVSQKACGQQVTGSGVELTCAALSQGDDGVAVAVLQHALGVTADGSFGGSTTKALKAAQTTAKLTATGTTTQKTWQAMDLVGTPACEPQQSADAKAQARIRKRVTERVAELLDSPGTTKDKVARQAIHWGKTQIGKPYIFGGTGPKGYDCSGLVMRSFQHAGITIPRVAADQYAGGGTKVSLADAQAGDLLFFASDVSQPSTVYHVVMYIGHGKVLSAPFTGTDVQVQSLFTTNLLPLVVRPTAGLTLPLKKGATGWSVTQLQLALDRHGNSLTADGGFGRATKKAVRAWQTKKGLTASGVVDLDTWLTLG